MKPVNPALTVARLHTPEAQTRLQYAKQKQRMRRQNRVLFALRGMANGIEDKDLCDMLDVTASGFRNMIYREMLHHNVSNRVQLVFYYIKEGILTGAEVRKVPTHGEGRQL